jgi:hypothetical protein
MTDLESWKWAAVLRELGSGVLGLKVLPSKREDCESEVDEDCYSHTAPQARGFIPENSTSKARSKRVERQKHP